MLDLIDLLERLEETTFEDHAVFGQLLAMVKWPVFREPLELLAARGKDDVLTAYVRSMFGSYAADPSKCADHSQALLTTLPLEHAFNDLRNNEARGGTAQNAQ